MRKTSGKSTDAHAKGHDKASPRSLRSRGASQRRSGTKPTPDVQETKQFSSHLGGPKSGKKRSKKANNITQKKRAPTTANVVTPSKSVPQKDAKAEASDEDLLCSSNGDNEAPYGDNEAPFIATQVEDERHAIEPVVIQHSEDEHNDDDDDSPGCPKGIDDATENESKQVCTTNDCGNDDAPTTNSNISSFHVQDVSHHEHLAATTNKEVVEDLEDLSTIYMTKTGTYRPNVYATNTFGSTQKEVGHVATRGNDYDDEAFRKEAVASSDNLLLSTITKAATIQDSSSAQGFVPGSSNDATEQEFKTTGTTKPATQVSVDPDTVNIIETTEKRLWEDNEDKNPWEEQEDKDFWKEVVVWNSHMNLGDPNNTVANFPSFPTIAHLKLGVFINWPLCARVVKKSELINCEKGGGMTFNVVLFDSSGIDICATFNNEAALKFFKLLETGNTYAFTDWGVSHSTSPNSCASPYEISFFMHSFIKLLGTNNANIIRDYPHVFRFQSLQEIIEENVTGKNYDVIGIVTMVSPLITLLTDAKSDKHFKCEVKILDHSNFAASITLWGEMALRAAKEFVAHESVVAFCPAFLNEFKGILYSLTAAGPTILSPSGPCTQQLLSFLQKQSHGLPFNCIERFNMERFVERE